MPDTYGKRQRQGVKAKKASAREERRLQRVRRKAARAAGEEDPAGENAWLGDPMPPLEEIPAPRRREPPAESGE